MAEIRLSIHVYHIEKHRTFSPRNAPYFSPLFSIVWWCIHENPPKTHRDQSRCVNSCVSRIVHMSILQVSPVAQWQSMWLLTIWSLVQIQPGETLEKTYQSLYEARIYDETTAFIHCQRSCIRLSISK